MYLYLLHRVGKYTHINKGYSVILRSLKSLIYPCTASSNTLVCNIAKCLISSIVRESDLQSSTCSILERCKVLCDKLWHGHVPFAPDKNKESYGFICRQLFAEKSMLMDSYSGRPTADPNDVEIGAKTQTNKKWSKRLVL